jgi:hypothetical protein
VRRELRAAEWAMKKLGPAIEASRSLDRRGPFASSPSRAAAEYEGRHLHRAIAGERCSRSRLVVHGSIADEVVEVLRASVAVDERARTSASDSRGGSAGIPITTVSAADRRGFDRSSFVVAASAYFLATLPNAGAEALLSHLTVGAHARLAEDGRKAVAQMGNQQRASAEVLIMFGQAIEREQRRMQSFERFMPAPVDPMLHSRILDMQKGITSMWTSMGITSSPFVPAAERIRGRGGEDLRVPSKATPGGIAPLEPPTAFLKLDDPGLILYELANFIDGKRSISDIRDAVSAEFSPIALPVIVDYFERLAKQGAVTIK